MDSGISRTILSKSKETKYGTLQFKKVYDSVNIHRASDHSSRNKNAKTGRRQKILVSAPEQNGPEQIRRPIRKGVVDSGTSFSPVGEAFRDFQTS